MSKPWKRLGPWLPGGEPTNDGDAALQALADVADVRRSLEQAELLAVRVARRHRKSWTEIATMLTISRQSAWERWRELDPDADADADAETRPDEHDRLTDTAARELLRRVRRRRTVTVPDLVGFTIAEALGILTHTGLVAVSATPDIELGESHDDPRPVVIIRQYPDPGTQVQPTSTIKLWLERGDGEAGVREPRRPTTPPRVHRGVRDERSEEAVA